MLKPQQRDTLRAAMNHRLADLRVLIADETATQESERASQRGGDVGDFGDEAVGADLVRTEVALVALHQGEQREIEAALGRLDSDHYGVCVDCADPIEFERLQANPTVNRCGSCQQVHEAAARR
jgi:RNA polymerase-binding transcription factor DksA